MRIETKDFFFFEKKEAETDHSGNSAGDANGVGPAGNTQFADFADQVDATLEDIFLELGKVPVARAHAVVAAPPDEPRVGHDVLVEPFFVIHVHLVLFTNEMNFIQ